MTKEEFEKLHRDLLNEREELKKRLEEHHDKVVDFNNMCFKKNRRDALIKLIDSKQDFLSLPKIIL